MQPKSVMTLLVALILCSSAASGQSMRHFFEQDYVVADYYSDYYLLRSSDGNRPVGAAVYWHLLGKESLEHLKAGRYQHWHDRDRIQLELQQSLDSSNFHRRNFTHEEYKQLVANKIIKIPANQDEKIELQIKKVAKSEEIFAIFGPELAEELIVNRMIFSLKNLYERHKIPNVKLSKFVQTPICVRALRLTDDQQDNPISD